MGVIRFGRAEGPPDPADAADRAKLAEDELADTRKAAEGWRNGLAGLIALVTTVSVVKGPETIEGLPGWAKGAVGILLLLALVCAVIGARLAIGAAYGQGDLDVIGESVSRWKHELATDARQNIEDARGWTYATIGFLVLAIGIVWYVPNEPEAVVTVETEKGTTCGVPEVVGQYLVLTEGDGNRVTIRLADVTSLSASRSCEKE